MLFPFPYSESKGQVIYCQMGGNQVGEGGHV